MQKTNQYGQTPARQIQRLPSRRSSTDRSRRERRSRWLPSSRCMRSRAVLSALTFASRASRTRSDVRVAGGAVAEAAGEAGDAAAAEDVAVPLLLVLLLLVEAAIEAGCAAAAATGGARCRLKARPMPTRRPIAARERQKQRRMRSSGVSTALASAGGHTSLLAGAAETRRGRDSTKISPARSKR